MARGKGRVPTSVLWHFSVQKEIYSQLTKLQTILKNCDYHKVRPAKKQLNCLKVQPLIWCDCSLNFYSAASYAHCLFWGSSLFPSCIIVTFFDKLQKCKKGKGMIQVEGVW